MPHPLLFPEEQLPTASLPVQKDFRSLQFPLWSENKARLIQQYIQLFTYVTKHGAYIDGFAAPQRRERLDRCSAKLVLEAEPKRIRDFWLCDIDPRGVSLLDDLKAKHNRSGRRVEVKQGDFNVVVDEILSSGRVRETTATFALLDQRMFECAWSTVSRLAAHKKGRKIELFYFFASGWIDKSLAAVTRPNTAQKVERWWGRSDWPDLKGMPGVPRAKLVAERFRAELGYQYSYPYAIHDRTKGGRTMYHMVHATDHPDAPPLMIRAYRKVSGRSELPPDEQMSLDALWQASQDAAEL